MKTKTSMYVQQSEMCSINITFYWANSTSEAAGREYLSKGNVYLYQSKTDDGSLEKFILPVQREKNLKK